jgi:hypothetical protein
MTLIIAMVVTIIVNVVVHVLGWHLRPRRVLSHVLLAFGLSAVIGSGVLFYLQIPRLDPNRLYEENGTPAAIVRDPQFDLANQSIIFGGVISLRPLPLDMNEVFEFRDWKLQCSGKPNGIEASRSVVTYLDLKCRIRGSRWLW